MKLKNKTLIDANCLWNWRLNTGMAPICDWMIIVKVNKLYFNSLLVSITACLEAEQWNINVKTPMCQTRNGYLHNEEKAESILFSEVVQRYSSDEKVIRCHAPLKKVKSSGGRPETGAIPVSHRWQEWLQLMRILIFFRSGWIIYTLRLKVRERFIRFFLCWSLQCLQMKPSFITTGPCSF